MIVHLNNFNVIALQTTCKLLTIYYLSKFLSLYNDYKMNRQDVFKIIYNETLVLTVCLGEKPFMSRAGQTARPRWCGKVLASHATLGLLQTENGIRLGT